MSKQLTIAQTIIAALQARNYSVIEEASRVNKYTVMNKAGVGYIWVGKSGAARFNNVKRVRDSVPLSDKVRRELLAGRADNLNATAI